MKKIRFNQIKHEVPLQAGIYEIYTDDGIPLKVGIGSNLQRRLSQHCTSRQSYLKLRAGGDWDNPSDVVSKGSILTKHLYYDKSITSKYNLLTEEGRREFLSVCCHILFKTTGTKELARIKEQELERTKSYRYVGKVVKR